MVKMNYWITTDTHFGHNNMVTKMKVREAGFEERILTSLSRNVGKEDVLIHLGDVSLGNDAYWNERIAEIGLFRWLVLGNHDKHSKSWYLNHGWHFVSEYFSMNIHNHDILFSHVPRCIEGYNYTINIHGHFHDNDHRYHEPELVAIKNDKQYLLALETNNYNPFNLNKIINDFNKKNKNKSEDIQFRM